MAGNGEAFLDVLKGDQSPPLFDGLANLGLGHPLARFGAGTALGIALVWAIRPEIAFSGARPLPHTLLAAPGEESTPLPWYFLAMLPGIAFAVFV